MQVPQVQLISDATWAQPLFGLYSYCTPFVDMSTSMNSTNCSATSTKTHTHLSNSLLAVNRGKRQLRPKANLRTCCVAQGWRGNRDKRLYLACKCPWDQISQGSTCHDVFKRLMVADRDRHQPQSKCAKLLCGTGLAGRLGQTNSASLYMCL